MLDCGNAFDILDLQVPAAFQDFQGVFIVGKPEPFRALGSVDFAKKLMTEAQVAVFTTTLDTLRMKMLGYRLVGKDTESPTQDFLAAITEARMQLESIDKALEELDLTAFPKTISIMPDETNSPGLRENLLHSGPPPMPEGALKQFEPASEIDQEQNSP